MRNDTFCRAALVALAALFLAATARAQTTNDDTFEPLQNVVKTGSFLTVTGASGGVFQGPLLDLSSTRLTLKVDGQPREFSIDDIRSVSRRQHADMGKGAGGASASAPDLDCSRCLPRSAGWALIAPAPRG